MNETISIKEDNWKLDLDYSGNNNFASFFNSNGLIHPYPAKAVPEVVNSLIKKIMELSKVTKVLDPFVGSGTVALESKYLGLDFVGSDLNPLSILLARTKTLTINNSNYFERQLRSFIEQLTMQYVDEKPVLIENFTNIKYWFKDNNIKELSYIKFEIHEFLKRTRGECRIAFSLILLTAFSSTIRTSSLTRNGEFKLYRMAPLDIENFNINCVDLFKRKVDDLLEMLEHTKEVYPEGTNTKICLANAKNLFYLTNQEVDLIITSPPYGDSQSTVAYGQFSRLSIQWMRDLLKKYLKIDIEFDNCDDYLLGGKKSEIKVEFKTIENASPNLKDLVDELLNVIANDRERLKELKQKIEAITKCLIEKRYDNIYTYLEDEVLKKLIKERIRLDQYRNLNKQAKFTNKVVKKIAIEFAEDFVLKLYQKNEHSLEEKMIVLLQIMPYIKETIDRKLEALPERLNEIQDFFCDLFSVVSETDRVLRENGFQAWIVGHRTIFGKVTVNMISILQDWFNSLGYKTITSLERQYSFKRLPHHINSTATRDNEIKTMMQEHILVVQKLKK